MEPNRRSPRGGTQSVRRHDEVAVALRSSDEQLNLFVQSVKDYAIFMLDTAGHVVTWNEGARRIKGYTEDEICGKHFSVFYPPEEVERGTPQRELEQAAAEGRVHAEGWRLRKDGTRFWADVTITAVRDRQGAVVGFGKVTRDATERREVERLREQFSEQQRIAEALPHIVWFTDAEGSVTNLSQRWAEYTGEPVEQHLGWGWSKVLHKDDQEKAVAAWKRSVETGEPYEVECRLRRADGAYLWHIVRALPFRDDRGIVSWFGTCTDISELKKAEETIRALSTPVLPVDPGLLILPLIGTIDNERASRLTEQLLRSIRDQRAKAVVIDLTGVASIDGPVANRLLQTMAAANLLGARAIVTGISREIAQRLVDIGVDMSQFTTRGDLRSGIEEARRVLVGAA